MQGNAFISEIESVINKKFICEDCVSHFNDLRGYLQALNIDYSINKRLVRVLITITEQFLKSQARTSAHRMLFAAEEDMTPLWKSSAFLLLVLVGLLVWKE